MERMATAFAESGMVETELNLTGKASFHDFSPRPPTLPGQGHDHGPFSDEDSPPQWREIFDLFRSPACLWSARFSGLL